MHTIKCPECQKQYKVSLRNKEGQRFRCGVCSCYFYVKPKCVCKIAEYDTYTTNNRNVVCPYCGKIKLYPLDAKMGCYYCSCGEIYYLRHIKHSVPEEQTPLQSVLQNAEGESAEEVL